MEDPSKFHFHGLRESAELCIRRAYPVFLYFSSLRDSIELHSSLTSAYPEVSGIWLALRHVPPWFRNINRIPFRVRRLRAPLGPTNCQLTNIADKPLGFRWLGFSPSYVATHGRIINPMWSTPVYTEASTHTGRLSTSAFAD